jgi:hypothetical protein
MSRLRNWPIKPIVVHGTGWKSTAPELPRTELIVAKAGTKVICPKCKTTIGRIRSDLYSGVSCRADQIEFASNQKKHANQAAICAIPGCGGSYMIFHRSIRKGTRIVVHVETAPGRHEWI